MILVIQEITISINVILACIGKELHEEYVISSSCAEEFFFILKTSRYSSIIGGRDDFIWLILNNFSEIEGRYL
jgi:hypothetical protein